MASNFKMGDRVKYMGMNFGTISGESVETDGTVSYTLSFSYEQDFTVPNVSVHDMVLAPLDISLLHSIYRDKYLADMDNLKEDQR